MASLACGTCQESRCPRDLASNSDLLNQCSPKQWLTQAFIFSFYCPSSFHCAVIKLKSRVLYESPAESSCPLPKPAGSSCWAAPAGTWGLDASHIVLQLPFSAVILEVIRKILCFRSVCCQEKQDSHRSMYFKNTCSAFVKQILLLLLITPLERPGYVGIICSLHVRTQFWV